MSKNLFKTSMNQKKDKNITSKNQKLSPIYKISDLVSNTKNPEEYKILQQQQQAIESHNMLLNYYSQKDGNNNIINNFIEKIRKLNNKFYTCSEKYISTKATFDKLSDDLYLNLFKQIDCYVEEIQRLNEKITSINDKDNKITIKKLTKELSENKEKIRNYELKLKEKTTKEEKLIKELESYKRRIIFFKNKINLNLLPRNQVSRQIKKNIVENNININNSIMSKNSSKNEYLRPRGNTCKSKIKKAKRFFSPSPEKIPKINNNESFSSSKNVIIIQPCSNEQINNTKIDSSIINSQTMNNTVSSFKNCIKKYITKNLITVNTNNSNINHRSIFSDGELENDEITTKIKINRKVKPKESIMIPFNKNYNKDDGDNSNFDDINKNININEYIEQHLTKTTDNEKNSNKYSPEVPKKLDNLFGELVNDSINSEKEEKINKNDKKVSDFNRNKKLDKLNPSYYSTVDIKNKTKTDKKSKNITSNKNSNNKSKIFKPFTGKKLFPTRKVFNLPSKKFNKSNLKNNSNKFNTTNVNTSSNNNNININNTMDNTTEDIQNNTMGNFNSVGKTAYRILKSKTVKFKDDEVSQKDKILNFTESESGDDKDSSKEISIKSLSNKRNIQIKKSDKIENKSSSCHSGNISDTYSKRTQNNENMSSEDNSLNFKNNKKIENKKNILPNSKSSKNTNKQNSNKIKINTTKDNSNSEQKNKDKEMAKILKEMNEDYNNDIEMLKTQEEQIKFLLNLIDLNEN